VAEGRNNRVKDYIHLIWVGTAIVICVTVSVFLDQMRSDSNVREHVLMRNHVDRCYEQTKEDIGVIREDVREMKIDVKELLKKSK
jgi:hypothetical protein